MIEAILFDLGKVIIDYSWEKTMVSLRELDPKLSIEWDQIAYHPALYAYERGRITTEVFVNEIINTLGLKLSKNEFLSAFNNMFKGIYPNRRELLKNIRREYKIYALSNINDEHYRYCLREFHEILSLFEQVYVSHLINHRKPETDAYKYICREIALNPTQILFIDDMKENIIAAEQLGFEVLHLENPTKLEQLLIEKLTELHM